MKLPDRFLDQLRERVSLVDLVGGRVTWDRRRSNPGRGDWWAPCPFHHEKTASFHVEEAKGRYYCFGCQAKGDAISFVMETENLGFMDAVRLLAERVGLDLPAATPEAQARAERAAGLIEILAEAQAFYRRALGTPRAAEARAQLGARGLTEATQARFGIGYAPAGGTALLEHLTARGHAPSLIEAAGLVRPARQGGGMRDQMVNRIIFPIHDLRGRVVAFGGRALSPAARAKYLNSPETAVFDKGRMLYNAAAARAATARGAPLVVAEGYMDVIALVQAGIEAAVAPLGTAITEAQLAQIWRLCPEPVVALDGDAAGRRAGQKLAERALPLLKAGLALRFATLPPGEDPDDLIRRAGPGAMRTLIEEAQPLSRLIWEAALEGPPLDSPERRAAFDRRLAAILQRIADPVVRRHYEQDFRRRRAALFQPDRPAFRSAGRAGRPPRAVPRPPPAPPPERAREAAILRLCLDHPAAALAEADALDRLPVLSDDLALIHEAILRVLAEHLDRGDRDAPAPATMALRVAAVTGLDLDRALGPAPVLAPGAHDAQAALAAAIERHAACLGVATETREAEAGIAEETDEAITWRLRAAVEARDRAARMRSPAEDHTQAEAMHSATLQALIDSRIWERKRR